MTNLSDSERIHMANVITGNGISLMRAFVCLQAIETHIKFNGHMMLTRTATPANLRTIASEYTGVQYARSRKGLEQAGRELREWYGNAMRHYIVECWKGEDRG
jgi:hypothetical protein